MVTDRHTDIETGTQNDYCNPPAHAQRVKKYIGALATPLILTSRHVLRHFDLYVYPRVEGGRVSTTL